jgi:hypothetical protein
MTAGLRDCDTCLKPFVDDEGWKKQCVVCWKGDKDWKLAVGDRAFLSMQTAYLDLREFNETVSAQFLELSAKHETAEEKLKKERRRSRALRKELKELKAQPVPVPEPAVAGALTQKQVMSLIKLCHPDKHKNSDLSGRVTRWLLTQRRRS